MKVTVNHKKYFDLKKEILEKLNSEEEYKRMAARLADETELTSAELSDLTDILENEFANFQEN